MNIYDDIVRRAHSSVFTIIYLCGSYIARFFRMVTSSPIQPIDGETILVTGAAGGIGREICKQLLQIGKEIKLVVWARSEEQLVNLIADLEPLAARGKSQVYPFAVDLSGEVEVRNMAQRVLREVGVVTIVVNNAGAVYLRNFISQTSQEIEQVFRVNVMSQIWLLQNILPEMASRNYGRILNISSSAALCSIPFSAPYVATKCAMEGYTESLKFEMLLLGHSGIHVTTVYPGLVATPMVSWAKVKQLDSIMGFQEPAAVAKQALEGMMRGQEYVYSPRTFVILPLINAAPVWFKRLIQAQYLKIFGYADPEYQRDQTMPYHFSKAVGNSSNNEDSTTPETND